MGKAIITKEQLKKIKYGQNKRTNNFETVVEIDCGDFVGETIKESRKLLRKLKRLSL